MITNKVLTQNRKIVFAGIAVGVVLFISGLLAYPFFFAHPQGQNHYEKLDFGGYAIIKAYHSDGTLYTTWEGHNALSTHGKNDIAGCLSGLDTDDNGPAFGSCSKIFSEIAISGVGITLLSLSATNTAVPDNCNFDFNYSGATNTLACNGWKSTATFDITAKGSVHWVRMYPQTANWIDQITVSPEIPVAEGDRLIVTITFTVS